jgi:TldD protein
MTMQFQRMPNVSLLPGERDISLDDINRRHAARHRLQEPRLVVDRPERFNFQFSGQVAYEVRNGKIAGHV